MSLPYLMGMEIVCLAHTKRLALAFSPATQNTSSGSFMAKSARGPVVPFQISQGLLLSNSTCSAAFTETRDRAWVFCSGALSHFVLTHRSIGCCQCLLICQNALALSVRVQTSVHRCIALGRSSLGQPATASKQRHCWMLSRMLHASLEVDLEARGLHVNIPSSRTSGTLKHVLRPTIPPEARAGPAWKFLPRARVCLSGCPFDCLCEGSHQKLQTASPTRQMLHGP